MSLPLVDLRAKITTETRAVLDALQRSTGKDASELVREVLAEWADTKIHEAILLHQQLQREGIGGLERRSKARSQG